VAQLPTSVNPPVITTESNYTHTLQNAVILVQALEPLLAEHGYHCGLTGGVIFRGSSTKDTDLIVYAHDPQKTIEPHELLSRIKAAGLRLEYTTDAEYTHREIILCRYRGARVDLFFLN
jgi:hypothetical protein